MTFGFFQFTLGSCCGTEELGMDLIALAPGGSGSLTESRIIKVRFDIVIGFTAHFLLKRAHIQLNENSQ